MGGELSEGVVEAAVVEMVAVVLLVALALWEVSWLSVLGSFSEEVEVDKKEEEKEE